MPVQPNQMSVRELLEMVFQNKWLFLLCTLCGLGLAVVAGDRMVKIYKSEAQILVDDRQSTDPMIQGLGVTTSVNQRFTTVKAKILSVESIRKMGVQLGFFSPKLAGDQLLGRIEDLRNAISINLGAGIINVRCERAGRLKDPDKDAKEPQKIVDFVTNAIIDENLRVRQNQITGARNLLGRLEAQYTAKLEQAEGVLKDFSEINQVDLSGRNAVDLVAEVGGIEQQSGGSRTMVTRLLDLLSRQADNEIKLKALQDKRQKLLEQIKKENQYTVTETTSAPSEVVRQLKERHAKAIADLTELRLDASDEHPLVQDKLAEIRRYEEQLKKNDTPSVMEEKKTLNPVVEQLRLQVSDLEGQIASLQTEQISLEKQAKDLKERVKTIPAKEMEKSRLLREQSINANMYQAIRLKSENAILTEQLEAEDRGTRFSINNPASFEPEPIRPHKKMVWAMGLFLGMVVGIVLSFVREFTDTSFRNLDDASRYLDLPVLGVIPEVVHTSRPRRRKKPRVLEIARS